MNNWDLIILLPILFVLCLITIGFIFYKEKIQKHSYLFILKIIIFWLITGYIGNELVTFTSLNNYSTKNYLLAIIFSASLFSLILKPLATYITSILKNRKLWIYIGNISLFIVLLLTFFLSKQNSIILLIFSSIFYSLSLSTSTIHYLFLNEQRYYRIYTIPVTWMVYTFIGFGTILGIYFSSLDNILINSNKVAFLVIFIILIILISIYLIFEKENKNLAGVFEQEIIKELEKKDNKTFLTIYLMVFLLSITSFLTNSMIVKFFLAINLRLEDYNDEKINMILRIHNFLYIIPSLIISYFIYKYLWNYFGQKYFLIINIFILFGIYTIFAFNKSWIAILILNIFAGICFNQIIYSLFSICMFWNYRSPKNPITGFFGTALFGGVYIGTLTEQILINKGVGIFKNFNSIEGLLNKSKEQLQQYLNPLFNIFTIVMAISAILLLIVVLVFYFRSNKILAEFVNYRLAMQHLRVILKRQVVNKTKTQIEFSDWTEEE